jgi:hypothetical protein
MNEARPLRLARPSPTSDRGNAAVAVWADALARSLVLDAEQRLLESRLSPGQRARLTGVVDPVPSDVAISLSADQEGPGVIVLSFYLISLEGETEIGHTRHRTLDAALEAARVEYGMPPSAWTVLDAGPVRPVLP